MLRVFFFFWKGSSLLLRSACTLQKGNTRVFFLVEEAYTQQGRAHIRRLHPDWAARPALMSRAAHAVESKAVELLFSSAAGEKNLGFSGLASRPKRTRVLPVPADWPAPKKNEEKNTRAGPAY
jgi:hypothetical protein